MCWRKSARESIKAKSKSLLQAQVIVQVAELKVKIGLSGSNLPPVLNIELYIRFGDTEAYPCLAPTTRRDVEPRRKE